MCVQKICTTYHPPQLMSHQGIFPSWDSCLRILIFDLGWLVDPACSVLWLFILILTLKVAGKSTSRLYTSHQACPVLQIQKCFYPGLNSIHWVEAVWWSSIPMGMKRCGLSDDRCLSFSAVGCSDCSNGDRDGPFTGSCNKDKAHWNVVLSLDICNYIFWLALVEPLDNMLKRQRYLNNYPKGLCLYRYWTRM